MLEITQLPNDTFSRALDEFRRLEEERLRRLHNRTRAVFAEFVVATLLGATVESDPGAAWDVTWIDDANRVRIQVKCAGDTILRTGQRKSVPSWRIQLPQRAWDDESKSSYAPSAHQCDVFVLALHRGTEIEAGWSFFVLPSAGIEDGTMTLKRLIAEGVQELAALELADNIRCAAKR